MYLIGMNVPDTIWSLVMIPHVYTHIGASLVAQMVKNLPARQRPGFNPWVRKIP